MTAVSPAHNTGKSINEQLASSNLCALSNSHPPIYRLLPEILTTIFIHGARDYHETIQVDEIHRHTFWRLPAWVNVSYVCRYWRNIALNCPTLWTYHFTVSLRWTEELLARSRQASLKIRIYVSSKKDNSWWSVLVEKLLVHIGRIQELRLRVPVTALPPTLSLHAPHLQILDIEPCSIRPDWTLTVSDGDVPPLRILKLVDCLIPWQSFNLNGVTTLSLHNAPAPRYNIVEFLATLPRMQALTALHLERALASARDFLSSGAFNVSPKISLPSLTRFSIAAPLSTAVVLLSRVNITSKTELRLEFQWEDGTSIYDYAQIPSVLTHIFTQFENLLRPTIRSLAIRSPAYPSTFTLCLSERDNCDPYASLEYPDWDVNNPLVIFVEMEYGLDRSHWHHILSSICCSIPPMDLHTLHIIDPPLSSDFWRKMLGHLHSLRRLVLSEGHMPDLSSLLAFPPDDPVVALRGHDHSPAAGQAFVPVLEELDLEYMMFASEDNINSLLAALDTRTVLRPLLGMAECSVGGDDFVMEEDTSVSSDE